MLNKLFRRRQQPDPVRLPPEYHWHRETLNDRCAMCGKDLPNRWPNRWTAMVAWTRPKETEPRAFGPVGVCCAGRLMPWPDEEMVHLALRLECSACGQEMGGHDYGVDSTHFLPSVRLRLRRRSVSPKMTLWDADIGSGCACPPPRRYGWG